MRLCGLARRNLVLPTDAPHRPTLWSAEIPNMSEKREFAVVIGAKGVKRSGSQASISFGCAGIGGCG